MMFSAMLLDAFPNEHTGIRFIYHFDRDAVQLAEDASQDKGGGGDFATFCLQMTARWLLARMPPCRPSWTSSQLPVTTSASHSV